MTLSELDEWYPRPPDKDNAAFVYTNIFAIPAFTNAASDFAGRKWPARGEKIEADELGAMKMLIATNAQAFALFRTAATMPSARYPVDLKEGAFSLLPHMAAVKQGAILRCGSEEQDRGMSSIALAVMGTTTAGWSRTRIIGMGCMTLRLSWGGSLVGRQSSLSDLTHPNGRFTWASLADSLSPGYHIGGFQLVQICE